jgi:DNA-binding GntR family transcriptional regulator
MSMDEQGRADDRISHSYQAVRELIVRGQLAPGTRIVEADVAERLKVSRTPVRSALQRLQQEGYILLSPERRKSRAIVAPLTKEDAEELFGIVGEIEGLAARRAAAGAVEGRKRLVGELKGMNHDLLACVSTGEPDKNRIFDLDSAFHRLYVRAGAGPRVLALHDAIKPQAERYIRLYINFLVDRISDSVDEHIETVVAIEQGDADRAQRAVQVNWRQAAARLATVIDSIGEMGSW